jgi:serine/threonine protein kinase
VETKIFGPDEPINIAEPLDTWLSAGLRDYAVPEAVGSSSRVFLLKDHTFAGEYADYPAIKIMRPDQQQYALPLFKHEVRILDRMRHVPGVTPMLALGFLRVDSGAWPSEIAPITATLESKASARQLHGSMDLMKPEEVEVFLSEIDARVADAWLAFIILSRRWEDNLFLRCDAGYTRGEFRRTFPVSQALQIASQICQIIQAAHERDIVYLDHKALHYYWNEPRQQVFVLDWNIGRQISSSDQKDMIKFDLLQFSARALHHMLTGRQASGSVNVGPNKPEDIQNAPDKYEPVWTYDDHERLTEDELNFLSVALQGEFKTALELENGLQALYQARQSKAGVG